MCEVNTSNELTETFEKAGPSGQTGFLPPHRPEIEDLNDMLRKFLVLRTVSQNFKAYTFKNHTSKIIYFSVRGLIFLPIAFSFLASNQQKKKLNLLDFRKD
jgi:hypothetical protein